MTTTQNIPSKNVREAIRRFAALEHPDDHFGKFLREFGRYSLDGYAMISFILPGKQTYDFHSSGVGLVKVVIIHVDAWPCAPPDGFRKIRWWNLLEKRPKRQAACAYSA
jgi:hypothetical protein